MIDPVSGNLEMQVIEPGWIASSASSKTSNTFSSNYSFDRSDKSESSSLANGNEASHAGGFFSDCPYHLGANIKLSKDGEEFGATIIHIYKGCEQQKFTYSCTMLVQVDGTPTVASAYSRRMVLKVFDWRYMDMLREDYYIDEWNEARYEALLRVPIEEQTRLRGWLTDFLPDKHRNNKIIQFLLADGVLPQTQTPTNMDLFGHVARYTSAIKHDYITTGLVPDAPEATIEELFLQTYADCQAAAEDHISQIIGRIAPGRMPVTHGIFNVYSHGSEPFQIKALLMDEAQGHPVGVKDTSATTESIATIMEELVSFQLQLWRCGLQFKDANMYNFLLNHHALPDDEFQLTVVDYGAFSIITPTPYDARRIMIQLPGTDCRIQLPQRYWNPNINTSIEAVLLSNFVRCLTVAGDLEGGEIQEIVEATATNCFTTAELTLKDSYIWSTIMLHIIYSFEEQLSGEDRVLLRNTVRYAQQIMTTEISKSSRPWWPTALAELVRITTPCAAAVSFQTLCAFKVMSLLLQVFETSMQHSPSPGSLAWKLVESIRRQPSSDISRLLFQEKTKQTSLSQQNVDLEHHLVYSNPALSDL